MVTIKGGVTDKTETKTKLIKIPVTATRSVRVIDVIKRPRPIPTTGGGARAPTKAPTKKVFAPIPTKLPTAREIEPAIVRVKRQPSDLEVIQRRRRRVRPITISNGVRQRRRVSPSFRICPRCNGRGFVIMPFGTKRCPRCKGRGIIR